MYHQNCFVLSLLNYASILLDCWIGSSIVWAFRALDRLHINGNSRCDVINEVLRHSYWPSFACCFMCGMSIIIVVLSSILDCCRPSQRMIILIRNYSRLHKLITSIFKLLNDSFAMNRLVGLWLILACRYESDFFKDLITGKLRAEGIGVSSVFLGLTLAPLLIGDFVDYRRRPVPQLLEHVVRFNFAFQYLELRSAHSPLWHCGLLDSEETRPFTLAHQSHGCLIRLARDLKNILG